MVKPEEELRFIKINLQKKLGHIGQVVINVIPEVELIIGKQPPVTELDSVRALNRFNTAFQNLISGLVNVEHPLMIFFDDIQYADKASLQFIKSLLSSDIRYVFFAGVFPNLNDPKFSFLVDWLKELSDVVVYEVITLQPLREMEISQLLKDTFGHKIADVNLLTEIVHEKTQGNPFYIKEFLKTLSNKHLLEFNYKKDRWQWNKNSTQEFAVAENVVDLYVDKIKKLNPITQEILKVASCIGNQFDLDTLIYLFDMQADTISSSILEAIENKLLLPVDNAYEELMLLLTSANISNTSFSKINFSIINFTFSHDRIQQVANQAIPEQERERLHLKIGRYRLNNTTLAENSEKLYEIMGHFYQCLPLIKDKAEKEKLALYFYWTSKKAIASVAYELAMDYLKAGLSLLPEEQSWQNQYALMFSFYHNLANCEYAAGSTQKAEQHFDYLLAKAKTNFEKALLLGGRSNLYSGLFQNDKSAKDALYALQLMKVNLPEHPSSFSVLVKIFTCLYLLRKIKKNNRFLDFVTSLEPSTDPEEKLKAHLLLTLTYCTFVANPNLLTCTYCELVIRAFKYGYTPSTWGGIGGFVYILIGGFEYFKLGAELFAATPLSTYKQTGCLDDSYFLTCQGILFNHWYKPYMQNLHYAEEAEQAALESGDIGFRWLVLLGEHLVSFFVTNSLQEVIDLSHYIFRQFNNQKEEDVYLQVLYRNKIINLLCNDETENIETLLQQIITKTTATYTASDLTLYAFAFVLYILSDYKKALEVIKIEKLKPSYRGSIFSVEYFATFGLLLFAQDKSQMSLLERWQINRQIKKIIKQFKKWSEQNADNFSHIYHLFLAENLQAKRQYLPAMKEYDQAIRFAQENNFLRYDAIINERAARFYLHINYPDFARKYLLEAYQAYSAWGASHKCKLLQLEYPEWLSELGNEVTFEETKMDIQHKKLDFKALINATQAISSEIELEKLFDKLLTTLLHISGAQRIVLIAKRSPQIWVVQAEATLEKQTITIFSAVPIQAREDLPNTLIQYVLRTHETLLVDEVSNLEHLFHLNDAYLMQVAPKSLLIIPILHLGEMSYVLYLENNLTTHAFTPQHNESLQLLATQAAISLQNASLFYQSTHDPLTGIGNRSLLYQTFPRLQQAKKTPNQKMAVLFFDVDYFKQINDSLGHEIGDQILIHIADNLKYCLHHDDLAIRLGGDEFVVILNNITTINDVERFIEHFHSQTAKPLTLSGHELIVSFSIGISLYPEDGKNIETLLKNADTSMYIAKESGRNQYKFYSFLVNNPFSKNNLLEFELQNALEKNEICLYYQPIYCANTNRILSVEALLRWHHPTRGIINASEFINLIKRNCQIFHLDEWILNKVCDQINLWKQHDMPMVPVAINIFNFQSKFDSLCAKILSIIKDKQVNPELLILELTETVLIQDTHQAFEELRKLADNGIQIVVDDFGTGFSNLEYLKKGAVISAIKIDQSFIHDLKEENSNKLIVTSMVSLAHQLKIKVIAEGVEFSHQYNFLKQIGIDAMQGFYLQKPLHPADYERLIITLSKHPTT